MLRLRALECTVLTIPHTCMYKTYKAIYKLSKLKYPDERTNGRTDEQTNGRNRRTDERTFVPLELLSQLKSHFFSIWKYGLLNFLGALGGPQVKFFSKNGSKPPTITRIKKSNRVKTLKSFVKCKSFAVNLRLKEIQKF